MLDASTMHQMTSCLATAVDASLAMLPRGRKMQCRKVTHLRAGPPLRGNRWGGHVSKKIWVKAAGIWSKRPLDAFWRFLDDGCHDCSYGDCRNTSEFLRRAHLRHRMVHSHTQQKTLSVMQVLFNVARCCYCWPWSALCLLVCLLSRRC